MLTCCDKCQKYKMSIKMQCSKVDDCCLKSLKLRIYI